MKHLREYYTTYHVDIQTVLGVLCVNSSFRTTYVDGERLMLRKLSHFGTILEDNMTEGRYLLPQAAVLLMNTECWFCGN